MVRKTQPNRRRLSELIDRLIVCRRSIAMLPMQPLPPPIALCFSSADCLVFLLRRLPCVFPWAISVNCRLQYDECFDRFIVLINYRPAPTCHIALLTSDGVGGSNQMDRVLSAKVIVHCRSWHP